MDKYLIIRLSSLGDILHALPAFSALRKTFPEAEISWVVEEYGKEILDLAPGIDHIIVTRFKNRSSSPAHSFNEFRRIQSAIKDKDQTAIDFQGLLKSGFLSWSSKAKKRIGFHRKNLKEPPASLFYTHRLEEIHADIHVIEKNLKLLSLLGVKERRFDFPLSIPECVTDAVSSKLKKTGWTKGMPTILFNIGAAWETKRWPVPRWSELITSLKNHHRSEYFYLILWGNENEHSSAVEIGRKTGVEVAPFLSIKEAMALIKEVSLAVSADTFALQAAIALARPVVALFSSTSPYRNGPFLSRDKVLFHELDCSHCYKRKCPKPKCLELISTEEVASICLEILDEAG